VLTAEINRYLALRRAAGFKLLDAEYWLRSYARFASKRREQHVRIDTAIEWAQPSVPDGRRRRLQHLSIFARYARVENPRHEVPDPAFFAMSQRERRLPFILDTGQIRSIVAATRELGAAKDLRPHTFTTMFGLLAVTGMRVGEALRLRITDYADGGLTIRNTKFLKSRWIPLHPSTCEALDAYLARRARTAAVTDHVFINERRNPCSHDSVSLVFATICRKLGVVRSDGPPHLHDLRHSFAVRALERCRGDRFAIRRHMIALTTYLGHAHIVSTYWYLHATPSLMSAIASKAERHFRQGAS
jgi:integrase